jgi:phytoene/squalene synthetase
MDLQTAFKLAEDTARKRSGKAWFMACLLVPRNRRRYLFLCYAYLRWMDNIVDDKTLAAPEKKRFIETQKKLLSDLSNRIPAKLNADGETFLYYFLEFALNKKEHRLIEYLCKMIDALSMDVDRLEHDGIFSEEELLLYISTLNNSMFNIVHSFIIPNNNLQPSYENLGQFLWYAGTFRDIFKDLESGYINLSREDISNYNIKIGNVFSDGNLNLWIKDKIPDVLNLLSNEILILRSMPKKMRLFWAFAYPFYIHKILRLKSYGYTYNYLSKIEFIKEIKTYLDTLVIGTKTVFKILI